MKKIFIVFYLLCTLLRAEDRPSLSLTSGFLEPESQLIEKMVYEVGKRAKIDISIDFLPNKRSLIQANKGVYDGEGARIWEINTFYPNLIPVPGQIHTIDLIALTNRKLVINKPSDLAKYNVGVIHGMKIAVLMAEKAKPISLYKAPSYDILFNMLTSNRLDVVITNRIGIIRSLEHIGEHQLFMMERPLMTRPLYMQLHTKNKAFIPRLQKAFEAIHADGTYTKFQDDFYKPYQNKMKTAITILKNTE